MVAFRTVVAITVALASGRGVRGAKVGAWPWPSDAEVADAVHAGDEGQAKFSALETAGAALTASSADPEAAPDAQASIPLPATQQASPAQQISALVTGGDEFSAPLPISAAPPPAEALQPVPAARPGHRDLWAVRPDTLLDRAHATEGLLSVRRFRSFPRPVAAQPAAWEPEVPQAPPVAAAPRFDMPLPQQALPLPAEPRFDAPPQAFASAAPLHFEEPPQALPLPAEPRMDAPPQQALPSITPLHFEAPPPQVQPSPEAPRFEAPLPPLQAPADAGAAAEALGAPAAPRAGADSGGGGDPILDRLARVRQSLAAMRAKHHKAVVPDQDSSFPAPAPPNFESPPMGQTFTGGYGAAVAAPPFTAPPPLALPSMSWQQAQAPLTMPGVDAAAAPPAWQPPPSPGAWSPPASQQPWSSPGASMPAMAAPEAPSMLSFPEPAEPEAPRASAHQPDPILDRLQRVRERFQAMRARRHAAAAAAA